MVSRHALVSTGAFTEPGSTEAFLWEYRRPRRADKDDDADWRAVLGVLSARLDVAAALCGLCGLISLQFCGNSNVCARVHPT